MGTFNIGSITADVGWEFVSSQTGPGGDGVASIDFSDVFVAGYDYQFSGDNITLHEEAPPGGVFANPMRCYLETYIAETYAWQTSNYSESGIIHRDDVVTGTGSRTRGYGNIAFEMNFGSATGETTSLTITVINPGAATVTWCQSHVLGESSLTTGINAHGGFGRPAEVNTGLQFKSSGPYIVTGNFLMYKRKRS